MRIRAVADRGRERDGGAFAGVIELAARHIRLGRGHVVVASWADRGGRARQEEGSHIGLMLVFVG